MQTFAWWLPSRLVCCVANATNKTSKQNASYKPPAID